MEQENVVVPETTQEVTPEVTPETTGEETIEEVRARAEKAEELANNYKIRAEKAEKKPKESVVVAQTSDLTSKDIIALSRANVSDEDVDEVIEYARFKKIPIAEALKNPVIQSTLKVSEEKRKTAQATNTGPARRSSVKVTDEEIVERASRGELPEDPAVLVRAQLNLKQKKN